MSVRTIASRLRTGLCAIFRRQSPALALTYPSFSAQQTNVLQALLCGDTLKSHRYFDGGKEFLLHRLNGDATSVSAQVVRSLEENGCLHSNQKFPAATLMLTERGRQAAQEVKDATETPSTSRILVATH